MDAGATMLSLGAEVKAGSLSDAVEAVLAACRDGPGLPAPRGWSDEDTLPQVNMGPVAPGLRGVLLAFDTALLDGMMMQAEDQGGFILSLDALAQDKPADALRPALDGMVALVTTLAERGMLRRAALRRLRGGHCLPILPLAEDATHLVACSADDIAGAYADAAGFASGWDMVRTHGSLRVHVRAADAMGNPGFLRRILPGHMAMARAARPGRLRLAAPRFAEGEFALLDAGEPTLTGIGYDAAQATYEFAGHIPPGGELRVIDLLNAWRVKALGEVDGHPVREVRAVFMNRAQAIQAAPFLRAADVTACWEDEAGRLRGTR